MKQTVNILLVEDHTLISEGIKSLLNFESDILVTGIANNANEALRFLSINDVGVIMADIDLPDRNGIELTAEIKLKYPHVKVIMLTILDNEENLRQAFEAGASGYLLKTINQEELLFAIRHVTNGGKYISATLALNLLEKNTQFHKAKSAALNEINLTKREAEVLQLIASGMSSNQIAEKTFTSKRTVEGHRSNLIHKTGAKNTPDLIRFASEHGIL